MQKLEILIEENAFGSVRAVEVVADAPVSALVPALVEELKLPQTDLFGKRLVYMLRQSSGGRILPENTTLASSGVPAGAMLALDSYVLDGTVASLAQNGPQSPYDPDLHSSATIADYGGFPVLENRNTSARLPAIKKKRNWTRRAFILAGVGIGATGLSYAAANGYMADAFAGVFNSINILMKKPVAMRVAQPTKPAQSAQPTQPVQPTMLKPQVTFTQHQQLVRTVAWSPDGMMLASGGDDSQLFIWGTNGAVMHNMQHAASVRAFAWAPDGQRFVTGAGTEVAFFDIRTGANLGRSTHRHAQTVMSLAWAAHGDMAVVSGGADRRAIVWDTMTYLAMTTFTLHTSSVEVVSWAADGQTVASSSLGGAVRVWNGASGQELHNYFQDANAPMRALAFAPTGTQLAVGGDDGMVRMWNGGTCQMPGNGDGARCMDVPQRLQASQKAIRSLAWSPDGRFLAVGADDGVLSVWDIAQNRKLLTSQQNGSVHSVTWSPDGKQLASAAGNTVNTWALV